MVLDTERSGPRTFKTLSHRDPEFSRYLDGSFSIEQVALPLRSLNVGTQTEEVTFEILDVADVSAPSFLSVTRALVRPSTLILSAGPMVAVLSRSLAIGRYVHWLLALACFVGVIAFQIATNLLNDYGDHMKGQDRVRPQGGSRAIQRGWIRAHKVKQIAIGLTGFAALCGVPAILRSPAVIVAGIALLFTLEVAFQRLRLKARGWAEGLAFLLAGPLLTAGFVWAVTGEIALGDLTLGCSLGMIALLYLHSANFENIMVDSQAGARTWATRAGFDASLTFYMVVAAACLLTSLAHAYVDAAFYLVAVVAIQALFLVRPILRVSKLTSPLSSGLHALRSWALRLSWITAIAFCVFYLYRLFEMFLFLGFGIMLPRFDLP